MKVLFNQNRKCRKFTDWVEVSSTERKKQLLLAVDHLLAHSVNASVQHARSSVHLHNVLIDEHGRIYMYLHVCKNTCSYYISALLSGKLIDVANKTCPLR